MTEHCATCGHERGHHSLYGMWCRWTKNPDSPSSSMFCKCMAFRPTERTTDAP